MPLRRAFVLLWISLWVAEPFLVLAGSLQAAKPSLCSTCGMKDKCGAICCCARVEKALSDCSQLPPGLYPEGCTTQDSTSRFLGENTSKWFPPAGPPLVPQSNRRDFHTTAVSIPDPASDLATPPPEQVFSLS